MVNSFRAEVLCRNCRSEIGFGKIAKPDFFVPEVSFRQYCQKSDSPVDLSACEKVPPVGGIGVRGIPLQARKCTFALCLRPPQQRC